jgi:SAM-dependent methyltransferase
MNQNNVDKKNSIFWTEICGTIMANSLGITDDGIESLRKFDSHYFNFYPYLLQRVPYEEFKEKDVLEVGLGYGTLSQILSANCRSYTGLDIAQGPVDMVNKRVADIKNAKAVIGNIKNAPFKDNSFDIVVAIGCYHHTGDIAKAVSETHRILRDGGKCYLMVYNKFSLRMWFRWPFETLINLLSRKKLRLEKNIVDQNKASDRNSLGEGPPETQYFSVRELKALLSPYFCNLTFKLENLDEVPRLRGLNPFKRKRLLNSVGRFAGLDIYITGEKRNL